MAAIPPPPTLDPKSLRFAVGMTDAFLNKDHVRGPALTAAANFPAQTTTIDGLAEHLGAGKAISVGTFAPGIVISKKHGPVPVQAHRAKAAYEHAQIIGLDCDQSVSVADVLADPFAAQYAAVIQPTPSSTDEHPRTRWYFVLDRQITDQAEYELLVRALLRHYAHLRPDPSCKDCSRFFYGSTKPGMIVRYAVLPVAVLEDLAADLRAEEARAEAERKAAAARRIPVTGQWADKRAAEVYEDILRTVASATSGTRNATLYQQAVRGFIRCAGGWPGFEAHALSTDLLNIAQAWGTEEARKAEGTIASAERFGMAHPLEQTKDPAPSVSRSQKRKYTAKNDAIGAPSPAQLSEDDPQEHVTNEPPGFDVLPPLEDDGATDENAYWNADPAAENVPYVTEDRLLERLTAFTADQQIDQQYVNLPQLLPPEVGALIVRSDVATGKTAAAIAEAQRVDRAGGRALYLTHRRALARDFTRRARKAGLEITHYQDVASTDQLRQISGSLAACIDTFVQLANGGALPRFDLLIIDELDQLLGHVYEGGTLRDRAPLAGQVLGNLIQKSTRVLAFDAHASATACAYLREQRIDPSRARVDDTYAVDNTHHDQRGALTLYEHRTALLAELPALIEANRGTVAVMCASEREAEQLAAQWSERLGGKHVLCLTADNAGQDKQRAFLADPDKHTPAYRVIFASPVLGTGFDIQAPVAAVVLLDQGGHLTAWDLRQMMGRFRRAAEVRAYVRRGAAELDPAQFDANTIAAAYRATDDYSTSLLATGTLDDEGRNLPPARLLEYTRWHSELLAIRNASKALARRHFLLLAEGYKVTLNTNKPDPTIAAEQAQQRKDQDARLRELALTVAPVNDKVWAWLREAGTITDEHRAGHTRYRIEDLTGAPIEARTRDLLWSAKARAAVIALTDQFDTFEALQNEDRGEALAGTPYHQRAYRVLRRALGRRFIERFMNLETGDVLPGMDHATIEALAAELHNEPNTIEALRRFCGRRLPTTAPGLIRAALRVFGLTMKTTRTGEARISTYALDAEATAVTLDLARAALGQRQRKRAEEEAGTYQKLRTTREDPPVRKSWQVAAAPQTAPAATPARAALGQRQRKADADRAAMTARFPHFYDALGPLIA